MNLSLCAKIGLFQYTIKDVVCCVPGLRLASVVGTLSPKHNFKETLTKHPTLNNIYETLNSKQDKTKNL